MGLVCSVEFSGGDVFVGEGAEIAAAGISGNFNKGRDGVYAENLDVPGGQFAGQPAFAATDVEDGGWGTVEYCVDDCLVGCLFAAFDLAFAYRSGPWESIRLP